MDFAFVIMLALFFMLAQRVESRTGVPLLARNLPLTAQAAPTVEMPAQKTLRVALRAEAAEGANPALVVVWAGPRATEARWAPEQIGAHWAAPAAFTDSAKAEIRAQYAAGWDGRGLLLEVEPGVHFDFVHHMVEAYKALAQAHGFTPSFHYRVTAP